MSCTKQKEVLLCLINMYKDMPYLWRKDHKDYMNKDMRAEGFKVLLEIYKNFDENATIKTLKKKLENMRTSYSKELKKVLASKHAGAEEVYVPSLWYYDALNFLESRTEFCRAVTDPLENLNSSSEESASVASSSGQQKRRRKVTLSSKQENILKYAENMIKEKDEEWEVYGRSIGFQLKDLNERQLIFANKMISDVIFYAKLEKLSENSHIVLSAPSSSYSSPSPSHQTHSQLQHSSPN